jgi:hypothetical protein
LRQPTTIAASKVCVLPSSSREQPYLCGTCPSPWEAWYFGRGAKPGEPSPFKWTYHFSLGVAEFAKAYISERSNGQVPTNKKVGVMFPKKAALLCSTRADMRAQKGRPLHH